MPLGLARRCGSRVAAYTCEVGPLQGGDATRLCLADGSWNGSAPTHCGCPVLTEPTYEKAPETIGITYSRGQAVGSVATYACDAGALSPPLIPSQADLTAA